MDQQNLDCLNFQETHGVLMSVAWFILENILIWSLYFKTKPYGFYAHAMCAAIIAFITALGPMLMIADCGTWIILQFWYHQTWGFVLYLILPFLLLSGSICLITKLRHNMTPQDVRLRGKAHSIFGWVFILLIKVPILTGWYGGVTGNSIFGFIVIIDIISYGTYLYLKFFKARMEQNHDQKKLGQIGLRSIRSLKDLKIYSQNYFIFANNVYDISPILGAHPGGWKIIEAVRARQVDRFIYGVDPIQFYNVPKHSHSIDSLNLAGPPIATLQIPRIYPMQMYNQAKVASIYCHDPQMKIHTIYLQLKNEQIGFSGYSDISQIGHYYALSLKGKRTRLYTAVNFLQPQNMKLISYISKGAVEISKKPALSFTINEQQNVQELDMELIKTQRSASSKTCIPLMIKKYNDGVFTSEFLSSRNKIEDVIISQSRGLGLSLDYITSKNIVLFAAGTGLYPFSDLIDLLFKNKLVQQNSEMKSMLIQSDSLLSKRPFHGLKFTLYLGVNQLDQLHPITLYQCNQLSKTQRFNCFVKAKGGNLQKLKELYTAIEAKNDRFEAYIKPNLDKDQETMFYMCGPVRFTKALVDQFSKLQVPSCNYKIV